MQYLCKDVKFFNRELMLLTVESDIRKKNVSDEFYKKIQRKVVDFVHVNQPIILMGNRTTIKRLNELKQNMTFHLEFNQDSEEVKKIQKLSSDLLENVSARKMKYHNKKSSKNKSAQIFSKKNFFDIVEPFNVDEAIEQAEKSMESFISSLEVSL